MSVDVLLRYSTPLDFQIAMFNLGIYCNMTSRDEEVMGHCSTPAMTTHQGIVRMVRFTDAEELAKLPDQLTPTFLVDWRSDEDAPIEDISYTADLTDGDGNLYVGVVYPGRIAG